jgi:hypothetical protein
MYWVDKELGEWVHLTLGEKTSCPLSALSGQQQAEGCRRIQL